MTHPTPTLAEPITIGKWWRNRAHEAITIQLSSYRGRNLIDIRVWRSAEGRLTPTKQGLAAEAKHLPRLVSALAKAESKARELHLIPDDDGGDQ
jgi:Transcriptional Coactivator p15 (PC4)